MCIRDSLYIQLSPKYNRVAGAPAQAAGNNDLDNELDLQVSEMVDMTKNTTEKKLTPSDIRGVFIRSNLFQGCLLYTSCHLFDCCAPDVDDHVGDPIYFAA